MLMENWFPKTKLVPPGIQDLLPRPRLVDRLRAEVSSRQVTLISAPAGSGKTTLIVNLLRSAPDLRAAWLTLDDEDDDSSVFIIGVVSALRTLAANFGTSLDTADPNSTLRQMVGGLINDILTCFSEPFVLVLDNLHRIQNPALYEVLDYWIDHMPPQMRLIVITRYDPPLGLARLRLRGQLAEIRLDALRFDEHETAALLNDYSKLALSTADVSALHQRTEGWAAGLRLWALTLEDLTAHERANWLNRIELHLPQVFDLLAEEVLAQQTPEIHDFLLKTSILSDLTAPLCSAVTERTDSQKVLQDLYRRNLFLRTTDYVGETYRYHDLFAAFLQRQLAQEYDLQAITALHLRAAEALTTDPAQQVHHYLMAEAWERAITLLLHIAPDLLRQGLFDTLRLWLNKFPDALRAENARLNHLYGIVYAQIGRFELAQGALERALEQFEAAHDEAGCASALEGLIFIAIGSFNLQHAAVLCERLLACPLPAPQQVQAYLFRSVVAGYTNDLPTLTHYLDSVLQAAQTSTDLEMYVYIARYVRFPFCLASNRLTAFENHCQSVLTHFPVDNLIIKTGAASLLSVIRMAQGRFAEAETLLQTALSRSRRLIGYMYLHGEMATVQWFIWLARGEYSELERDCLQTLDYMRVVPATRPWYPMMYLMVGIARWQQKRLDDLRQAHSEMRALYTGRESVDAQIAFPLMDGIVQLAQGDHKAARAHFHRAVEGQSQIAMSQAWCDARLFLAYAYHIGGDTAAVLDQLDVLLPEYEYLNAPGLIVRFGPAFIPLMTLAVEHSHHTEFAQQILDLYATLHGARTVFVPETGETLTEREVEILRLITQGVSNQAIADQLVISIWTVKSHITHILRKLDVKSRGQAAVWARELNLL